METRLRNEAELDSWNSTGLDEMPSADFNVRNMIILRKRPYSINLTTIILLDKYTCSNQQLVQMPQ